MDFDLLIYVKIIATLHAEVDKSFKTNILRFRGNLFREYSHCKTLIASQIMLFKQGYCIFSHFKTGCVFIL